MVCVIFPAACRNSPHQVHTSLPSFRPAGVYGHTGTSIAPAGNMRRSSALGSFALSCHHSRGCRYFGQPPSGREVNQYRESRRWRAARDRSQTRFNESQLAVLEKLNRADVEHLEQLREIVVPASWVDEFVARACCRCDIRRAGWSMFLVVLPARAALRAYEFGTLVRWGPVSTGSRSGPTSPGLFALNWRSTGRASTVDPDWFMPRYFNFGNREGLGRSHEYSLPAYPASHGCIRLLEGDAQWLFEWGTGLDAGSQRKASADAGHSRVHLGHYDFDAPPPWRSLTWLSGTVELPPHPRPRSTRGDAMITEDQTRRHRLPGCAIHARRRDG